MWPRWAALPIPTTTFFPGIVSRLCGQPCGQACVFSEKGGAIVLRELEMAAVAHAPVGRMTVWVEYRNLENCRELVRGRVAEVEMQLEDK